MTIIPEAISWTQRRIKVASKWYDISPRVNLKQLRIGQTHEVETATALDGSTVLMRVIK